MFKVTDDNIHWEEEKEETPQLDFINFIDQL